MTYFHSEYNADRRPTLETLHRLADKDSFSDKWAGERLQKGLGGMAAATLELSSKPVENPEYHFAHIAESVESFDDGAVIFLKEPVGKLGFLALVNSFDIQAQRDPMTDGQGRYGARAGYVADRFVADAPRLLARGGWEPYNRTACVGMFDKRVKARQYGAEVVRPSADYVKLQWNDGDPVVYSQIPVLSSDAAMQRKFAAGVTENMRERSSEDEIEYLTDSIAYVTPMDGATLADSDLIFAHDLAKAIDDVNKAEHFSGEHRSKGQFAALLHWFAYHDTKDLEFADAVKNMIPYKTGNDMLWDRARYSQPQPALVMSSVRGDLLRIAKAIAKIDGFGLKARVALEGMIETYDARQVRRSVSVEALVDPRLPAVERLGYYDKDDARELGSLLATLSPRFNGEPVKKERIEEIINSPDRELIIARVEGKIIATATMNIVVGLGAGKSAYLNDFVTSDEVRGKGGGTLVWDEIIAWCYDHKAEYLEFTSRDSRDGAHAFYERRGAERRDTNVFRIKFDSSMTPEA